MSRSTTMFMLFLVPMIGQAAIVQQNPVLTTYEPTACRGNLNVNSSRSRGVIRANGRVHRLHQVDTGAMLAMGYSYYGAQRAHRAAAARKSHTIRGVKKTRRGVVTAGYTYRVRHAAMRPARCIARTHRAWP